MRVFTPRSGGGFNERRVGTRNVSRANASEPAIVRGGYLWRSGGQRRVTGDSTREHTDTLAYSLSTGALAARGGVSLGTRGWLTNPPNLLLTGTDTTIWYSGIGDTRQAIIVATGARDTSKDATGARYLRSQGNNPVLHGGTFWFTDGTLLRITGYNSVTGARVNGGRIPTNARWGTLILGA